MASVKIIHYTHKVNSDGTSPVIIQVIQDGKVKKKTIANILEDQWNDETKRVIMKKHPNAATINKKLSDGFNRIEGILFSGEFDIDAIFKSGESKPPSTDFIKYFEKLIADTISGDRVKPKSAARYAQQTINNYSIALSILKRYMADRKIKTLTFDDINLEFYYDYKDYFFNTEKLSDNYFGAATKVIKICMAESQEAELHNNTAYKSKRFVNISYEADNVYLTEAQLTKFAEFDFSNKPTLDRVRDLFLVGCWTGLRFSDFNNIDPKNIEGDFIDIKTQKTGKSVVIPIHESLRAIINKYKDKTPNSLPPPITNQRLNSYIKDALKDAKFTEAVSLEKHRAGSKLVRNKPLHDWVTTHTARRSFASNMFRMGVPTLAIMAITGHRTESSFLKYIKLTPREMAEIMREIWNRKAMKAV